MSRKISEQKIKYLQKQINGGKHPNYYAKLLNVQSNSIVKAIRKIGLTLTYESLCFKKYETNKKLFKNIKSEEEAYYLGFILADGCVSKKRNSYGFSISIQERDGYILDKLSLLCLNKINSRHITKKSQVCLTFTCKDICKNLINYGCISNKTYKTNSFPLIKENLMPHFIRGYFDGDGCVYTKKQRYNYGSAVSFTGNYIFISSLEKFLKNRKIITTSVTTKQKKHQFDAVFEFEKKQDIYNLYKYMYIDASIYLIRKKEKFIV